MAVVEHLRMRAKPVEGKKEIAQLATISAADETIGQLIADVMDTVTIDGVITVKESQGTDYEIEYVKGMQFDRGYISPAFITDQEKMEASLENPYILITDRKISAIDDLLPIIEKIMQQGRRELVVIAEEVESEALTTLVVNKMKGILNVVAVRAPSFGDRRKEVLRDIAILTGGRVISEEVGQLLRNAKLSDLGSARSVVTHKEDMTIIDGKGAKTDIQVRMREVRAQLSEATSDYDREKLEERLVKLARRRGNHQGWSNDGA